MKYEPKKVFIIEKGTYKELTYRDFCQNRKLYEFRYFIPLQGMLLEVSKEAYTEFYQVKERNRYLKRLDIENGLIYIDAFHNENEMGSMIGSTEDIADKVTHQLMQDKLRECIALLKPEEQILIQKHYYDEITEVELGKEYAVSQQAISKRLKKIREKLRKMMEM